LAELFARSNGACSLLTPVEFQAKPPSQDTHAHPDF
jgi:hypothetical protein